MPTVGAGWSESAIQEKIGIRVLFWGYLVFIPCVCARFGLKPIL